MKKIKLFILSILVMLLTGCGGTLKKWKEETFTQASTYNFSEYKNTIKHYLHSLSLYDQFATVALFDALWLSDEMRMVISDIHVELLGKNREVRNNLLRRQLKDNSEYVTFYVLSQHIISLVDHPTQWNLYLKIDDISYSPASVKLIEINPEYRIIFGQKLTVHKDMYEVKFLRINSKGKDILSTGEKMELFFNGLHHFGIITWSLSLHHEFLHALESFNAESETITN